MPLFKNPRHHLMMENFVDHWISMVKKPDMYLHSNDGYHFAIHKEMFSQTRFMRDILAGVRKTHGCCGKPRISIPCNKEHLEHILHFLYLGEIRLDMDRPDFESHLDAIFENLEKIFGYPKDMKSNCTEGEDPDEDSVRNCLKTLMCILFKIQNG